MGQASRRLYLCAGLEESRASLVSWCFWQHPEMRPAVAWGDVLPELQPSADGRPVWLLAMLQSFRLEEMTRHYQDLDWQVHPLLVVRDLREVWAGLVQKPGVRNGLTAEDPPLRLRFRRFVDDWEWLRQSAGPMVRVEDLARDPQSTLRQTCSRLELSWHDVMWRWPRPAPSLDRLELPDASFHRVRGWTLAETLAGYAQEPAHDAVARQDLEWLQSEFQQFNLANNYPPVLKPLERWGDLMPIGAPARDRARRFRFADRLLNLLGMSHRSGRRRTRRAA